MGAAVTAAAGHPVPADRPIIDWSARGRPLPGETESGDRHMVAGFADGALLAVIDGLGHGRDAAIAASIAVSELERDPAAPLAELVARCHTALRRSRGAVLSLVRFNASSGTLNWTGVGNVAGVLARAAPAGRPAREALLARSGVVGYRLPPLRVSTLTIEAGDAVALATDGIAGGFDLEPLVRVPPDHAAADILDRHGKESDDALVLVARYLGLGEAGGAP